MTVKYRTGDRVQVRLNLKNWKDDEWFDGTIVRIEPYSQYRSFHWVELDEDAQSLVGVKHISIFNPRNIRKV